MKGVEEYKFYLKEDEKGGGQKQIGGMLVLPPSLHLGVSVCVSDAQGFFGVDDFFLRITLETTNGCLADAQLLRDLFLGQVLAAKGKDFLLARC